MAEFDCDFFVIGAGSGGVRAARMAAQRGVRVIVAEAGALGGTCVNVGCIPKKLYSYAAHYAEDFEDAHGFGWDLGEKPRLDWARLKARRAAEIARLNGVYGQLLDGTGVRVERGWAQLAGANAVRVRGADGSERAFTARHILVATGGEPSIPDLPGREHVLSSDQMFDLAPFPGRLLVVGGGYIACEFASIFNGLGARVTQVHRGTRLLSGFDADVARVLAREMQAKGVEQRLETTISGIARAPGGELRATLSSGDVVAADAVLYATGRRPRVAGLDLEAAGVALDARGAIQVNEHYQSSIPSIHAVGDVSSRLQLTPVALGEAMALVDRLFGPPAGKGARTMGYDFIPTAVFTHPNIGTVGWTEDEARKAFNRVTVFRSEFRALKHTLSGSTEKTFMKLLVDAATDRVIGLHMVGPEAGEIVQGFAVAMKAGATKALFDSTVGIHPTAAEEFVTMREPVAG